MYAYPFRGGSLEVLGEGLIDFWTVLTDAIFE